MQTTRNDICAIQSQLGDRQLRDRQSGDRQSGDRQTEVGIEPLTFELATKEPNPLAITACIARSDVSDSL